MNAPTHSPEAERAVLAAILVDNAALDAVSAFVSTEDFYAECNARIFEAACHLALNGAPVDIVTLRVELETRHALTRAGGEEYLLGLSSDAAGLPLEHVERHARIVRERATVRRLAAAARDIVARTAEPQDGGIDVLCDYAEHAIWQVGQSREVRDMSSARDLVVARFNEIKRMAEAGTPQIGLSTGFDRLDAMLAGLKPGELIIVAGRPGMGKSALAGAFAANACASGSGALVFSLEMGRQQWIDRTLSSEARVFAQSIRTGRPAGEDWPKLATASQEISRWNLWIDDTPGLTVMQLRSKARRAKAKHGIGLVIVDYLQLMSAGVKTDNREQEVATISRAAKLLAREIEVPVVMLAQLNRGVESRADKRPGLSDLRESGAIEQDADVVLFVYRDEVYNPKTVDVNIAELIVGKQRSGPLGTVRTRWFGEFTRFDQLEEWEERQAAQ